MTTELNDALLARLKGATATSGGNYLAPNTFGTVVLVGAQLRKGYKGQSAIFEFVVESAEGKSAGPGYVEGIPQKPGTKVSQVLPLDSGSKVAQEMAWNNLKRTLQVISQSIQLGLGEAPVELGADESVEVLQAAISKQNPFGGVRLAYDTKVHVKDNGEVRSYPMFSADPANKADQMAERVKKYNIGPNPEPKK